MKPNELTSFQWLNYNLLFFLEHFFGHRLYQFLFGSFERRMINRIKKRLDTNPKKMDTIVEIFEERNYKMPFYHPHKVRIFKGAAKEWNCTRNWSLDYFEKEHGHQEIVLFQNKGLMAKDTVQDFDTTTLKEYIRQLKAGSKQYLKFSRVVDENSKLKDDFDHTFLEKFHQPGSFSKLFFFFMGGKSTSTPIHCGFQPTVFVQIEGLKKWTFYHCEHRVFLGVRPERMNYFFSEADTNNPDSVKFPLLKHATPYEVILEPGDVMYFPALVWHQVENLTDSIGVAYKFVHVPSAWRSSKTMTLLYFLATKPFLPYSILFSRLKKKDPVFIKKKY